MGEPNLPRVSVVVATYERPVLLERLLRQLAAQDLDPASFEVVVVDDGSTEAVAPRVAALGLPIQVAVERQENAGAAAARHRGVLAARGGLVVIVDDDMQVGPGFLSEHLRAHPPGSRRAVLGAILPPPDVDRMPLFERWHQKLLEDFARKAAAPGARLRGNELYTANVSFHREDYLAVGGFDPTLERSEDSELGLRLESSGVEIGFSAAASTVNGSDHTSLAKWRARAVRYGRYDVVIARKHPTIRHASPWRHFSPGSTVAPVLKVGPSVLPLVAPLAAGAVYAVSAGADRIGWKGLAYRGTGVTFGIDYYRGLCAEMGGRAMIQDLRRHLREAPASPDPARADPDPAAAPRPGALARMRAEIRADYEMNRATDAKYGKQTMRGRLLGDSIQKIGLQMMIAIRTMRYFRNAGVSIAAKIASRSIRHLYGSDIHWDAEFEPGVVISHGMGIAITGGAYISTGCILAHGVTIGMGIDPDTRAVGAPRLERNVHVGPGATILGPIVIGEGSKIQAGALVMTSVPPRSMVLAPRSEIRSRDREAPGREAGSAAAGGQ